MKDKDKIKQEIERLYAEVNQKPYNGELEGEMCAYDKLISFIDSLPEEPTDKTMEKNYHERYKRITQTEQFKKSYCDKSLGKEESVSEDLEEEIDEEIDNLCELGCYMEDLAKGNSEGVYPLPDNVVKELRKFASHFAEWQKQQMMKDAQLGVIEERADGLLGWNIVYETDKDYRNYLLSHFKNGDNVKIIIVKENIL